MNRRHAPCPLGGPGTGHGPRLRHGSRAPRPRRRGRQPSAHLHPFDRRLRLLQERRLGHDEQPHGPLVRGIPALLPERPPRDRGQGLLDGAAGPDRGHGHVRPDEPRDEEQGEGRVRRRLRLRAHLRPHEHRHARGVRPQGQPDRPHGAHAPAGRRHLLEDAQGRAREGHPHVGRRRPHGRVGQRCRSASTAATPPRAPTATSRSTRSSRATTRTP